MKLSKKFQQIIHPHDPVHDNMLIVILLGASMVLLVALIGVGYNLIQVRLAHADLQTMMDQQQVRDSLYNSLD